MAEEAGRLLPLYSHAGDFRVAENKSSDQDCIFCRIVANKSPSHRIWEDDKHLAFLSIYPNTPGVTVVIPKAHRPSYVFDNDDETVCSLMKAARKVAGMLDQRLEGVGRGSAPPRHTPSGRTPSPQPRSSTLA